MAIANTYTYAPWTSYPYVSKPSDKYFQFNRLNIQKDSIGSTDQEKWNIITR
jgi:hypothetical protein